MNNLEVLKLIKISVIRKSTQDVYSNNKVQEFLQKKYKSYNIL